MKDINEDTIHRFLEEIRPKDLKMREQIDFEYSYEKQTFELYEIRPKFQAIGKMHMSFAKIRYVKTQAIWKLYWMRGSGKWESYEPMSEAKTLKEVIAIVRDDKHYCFFGWDSQFVNREYLKA